jgi:hypothetical protein
MKHNAEEAVSAREAELFQRIQSLLTSKYLSEEDKQEFCRRALEILISNCDNK